MSIQVDLVIIGGGIAGLWTLNHFRAIGHSALLLETKALGTGQTIGSQGIIHSGLKYALAGKMNAQAQSISAMPDLWRKALAGKGNVDLSKATGAIHSQHMMIPSGIGGALVKLVSKNIFQDSLHEIDKGKWPQEITDSGFKGSFIFMDEPVLDTPAILEALAAPHKSYIKKLPEDYALTPRAFLDQNNIKATTIIYTAAASNHTIATAQQQNTEDLKTQHRPLLMGMMKDAPFDLWAHFVGMGEKPAATITTHYTKSGERIWYIGGAAAERKINAPAKETIHASQKAIKQYLPKLDIASKQWAVYPVDRVEGKALGWMPDMPTIHQHDNHYYCWPTKLTFAPLLAQELEKKLGHLPKTPQAEFPTLDPVEVALPPWEDAQWMS